MTGSSSAPRGSASSGHMTGSSPIGHRMSSGKSTKELKKET